MLQTPRIEISRPGRFTAVDGKEWDFTTADLAASAAGYDAAGEPAPLVVGHPALDAPAYGWVQSLAVEGDKLVATPKDVAPEFAEAVRAGRYRRVSASWYQPDHPQNPKPGIWSLKHIGFLGGAAPAIRGLAPVHFSEAQLEGAVTIDLELKEIPVTDPTADFAAQQTALDERRQELDQLATDLTVREATILATERQAVHAGHAEFAEAQIAAGRLAPAGRAIVVGLLDALATVPTVNFGEAEGELAPVDALKKLMSGAAPIVSFAEEAKDKGEDVKTNSPEDIAVKAVAFAEAEAKAGRTVTTQAAVRHVMAAG